MPIHHVQGDIFTSPAQTIVNPVNCVGVMGKGLAAQFKSLYPDMFTRYKKLCDEKRIRPGILMYATRPTMGGMNKKLILNFPTKDHWRDKSELEYIEKGLKNFVANYEKRGVTSVAFPPLGCGLGGLPWSDVRDLMEKYLRDLPINVYIYQPSRAFN